MQTLTVQHTTARPVEAVFAALAHHEGLTTLVPGLRVRRVRDGDTEPEGVGSVRRFSGVLPPFEETVVEFERPHRIVYRITKGTPLTGHRGVQTLEPTPDGGTRITWEIVFGSWLPGFAPLFSVVLGATLRRGLERLVNPPA